MSIHDASTDVSSIRFWNIKAASLFILVVLTATIVVVLRQPLTSVLTEAVMSILNNGPLLLGAALISLYCCHAAFILLMGVALTDSEISFPCANFRAFAFLDFGRTQRPIAELDEITYVGRTIGIEWLVLQFGDNRYPAPFASRDLRLAFFAAIKAKKPNVRIYRAS